MSAEPVVPEPVVQAFGLGKDYGKLRAVEAVDITVNHGEFFGFLGPNGAGKTTMIHMLTTLVGPTRGRAEIAGHDVVAEPLEVRKHIGLVFQETTLDGELSAEENLQLAGKLYGLGRAELKERIAEVLELFELTDRRHDSVRTFSGGMRRQVDLARGILHRPAVLFLDEPTLGLDPVNRGRVWGFLERLASEEGMTLFLTTHYLEEAEPCDRVMIVDRGQVIAQGTPTELKRDLGGRESIELVMSDPDPRLLADIARRTGSEPRRTSSGVIVAVDSAEEILPMLLPLIGDRLESLSVRKPTLDDVFVAATTPGTVAA
ncbi:MAG TPA: ATP-binding cassette domain-containing protein [Solirubrobacterales bacterium]|nr:ATP-binding cassette domain-containing protein [Solirubrobacterales bacterium]